MGLDLLVASCESSLFVWSAAPSKSPAAGSGNDLCAIFACCDFRAAEAMSASGSGGSEFLDLRSMAEWDCRCALATYRGLRFLYTKS